MKVDAAAVSKVSTNGMHAFFESVPYLAVKRG